MTTAILTIIGGLFSSGLVALIVWIVRRRIEKKESPQQHHTERLDEYAREVIQNDEASANVSLDADLDRLRQLKASKGIRRNKQ